MSGSIYFDNAASCRPFDWALEHFAVVARESFGNQEAAGALGLRAAKTVKEASVRLAAVLAPGSGVLWCNSGTEALAAAVRTHCMSHPGTEIVTTKAEHPALKQALRYFAAHHDLTIRYAEIGRDGMIRMDTLSSLLNPRTSLLAVHHVNAETGAIQDLQSLRGELDRLAPKARFLADTTQSVCKIAVPWQEARLDFITLSGCKTGAPCGAALLWRDTPDRQISKGLHALRGQHHGVGRCIPAAAATIAEVAERLIPGQNERAEHAASIRSAVRSSIPVSYNVIDTIPDVHASPYILHLIFPDHQGAVLVRILESEGISAAAGSACMAETPTPSETLTAMGYGKALAFGALRLSFWDDTRAEDAEHFKKVFNQVLKNY